MLPKSLKELAYACSPSSFHHLIKRVEASDVGARLAKGVFWSMAGSIISRGLMLCAMVLVARMLGQTGFGELGMIQSTVGMFGVFAGFGLALTATKHVAEFRDSDPDRVGRILGLSSVFAMLTGGSMALGLFFLAPWLAERTIDAPQLASSLRIGALILFINALNGAQTGALSGFEAFKAIARVNLFVGLVSFPVLVSGAYFGGLTGAIWALAINLGINWLLNHLALRREARRYDVPLTTKNASREIPLLWTFSLPLVVSGAIVGPVKWAGNAILVNESNGYAELGLYVAVGYFLQAVMFLTSNIARVYVPILSSSYSKDPLEKFRSNLKRMLLMNGTLLAVTSTVFLLLSPFVMSLYGDEYGFKFPLVVFLTLATAVSALGGYLFSGLVAMNLQWYGLVGNGIWAILYLSIFSRLSHYGATGMALSLLISQFIAQAFIGYHILNKVFGKFRLRSVFSVFRMFSKTKKRAATKRQMSTTTGFFRNTAQLSTLLSLMPSPQRIHVFGCSTGCEAYGLAMIYDDSNSSKDLEINGFDIDKDCVKKAKAGLYEAKEVFYAKDALSGGNSERLLSKYLKQESRGTYRVTNRILTSCIFADGNLLDSRFMNSLDAADIVVCQNVLIHMSEEHNREALKLIMERVRPEGLLIISGMRLSIRAKITQELGLMPVTENCREIHESQLDLRRFWDDYDAEDRPYFAMPPFEKAEDWKFRFTTIFRVPTKR